jgi:16S rRNA (adenine1518-N6/adenine1519-N6)-dimethyltransferase
MILIVQKEIAQKICSKPPKMNILAISVLSRAKAKIIGYISKKSFWPSPKVDSAIIKITPGPSRLHNQFFKIVKAGFSQPRKQLAGNLANKLNINKEEVKRLLLKNNIQPGQRAETLTIKDWIKLTKSFCS